MRVRGIFCKILWTWGGGGLLGKQNERGEGKKEKVDSETE